MTKKLTTLLMLLTLCLSTCAFTSCGDDDDDNNNKFNASLLVGRWQGVTYSSDVIVFAANGTGHDEYNGNFSDQDYFTYSVQGDKLIIKYDYSSYDTDTYTIQTLTENSLVIEEDGDSYTYRKVN